MYYLDSCICIDLMRGHLPVAYDLMKRSDPSLFRIPSIVVGELLCGVERSTHVEKNRLLVERFLQPFAVAQFDEAAARAYGRIRAHLQKEGMLIGPNDLLIAATALAHQAVLVSNNAKEFKRIPELRFESWYESPI